MPIEGISCWRLQLNLCFHARWFKAVMGDRFDPGLPWADGVYLDMCFSSFCAAFFWWLSRYIPRDWEAKVNSHGVFKDGLGGRERERERDLSLDDNTQVFSLGRVF